MKKFRTNFLWGGVVLVLSMLFASCGNGDNALEEIINGGGSGGSTPTVEEVIKYGFKVTDLTGVDRTEAVTSLKMSNEDGTLVVKAEVSGGKITITNTKLTEAGITAAADFWFEAEIDGKPYIAKVTIDPTALSPESDKTLEMATLGDVILADGTFAVSTTEGTKVAMIAYVGSDACKAGDAPYNHGLALALKDAPGSPAWDNRSSGELSLCLGTQYDDSKKFIDLDGMANTTTLVGHTPHSHPAAVAASEFKYKDDVDAGTHPDGTSAWFLPSAGQWDKMATAAGSYANLKTNANLQLDGYWSSTENGSDKAWYYSFGSGVWGASYKYYGGGVRACLAF